MAQEILRALQSLDNKLNDLKANHSQEKALTNSRLRATILDYFDRLLAPSVTSSMTWEQTCSLLDGLIHPTLFDRISPDTAIATLLGGDVVNVQGALTSNNLLSDRISNDLLAKVFHLVNAHRELDLIAASVTSQPQPDPTPVNTPMDQVPGEPDSIPDDHQLPVDQPKVQTKRKAEEPLLAEAEPKKRKGTKKAAK